jgi:uncharacterized protein
MRRLIIVTAFYIFLSIPASTYGQDFKAGLSAIESGDYEEAVRIFREAAEKGDKHAQHCLGVMLHKGLGVKKNNVESFKWLELAAEQGLSQAKFDLGILIYHKTGVPLNYIDKQ